MRLRQACGVRVGESEGEGGGKSRGRGVRGWERHERRIRWGTCLGQVGDVAEGCELREKLDEGRLLAREVLLQLVGLAREGKLRTELGEQLLLCWAHVHRALEAEHMPAEQ